MFYTFMLISYGFLNLKLSNYFITNLYILRLSYVSCYNIITVSD